jgi:single-strand DNA-binding protein
MYLNKVFLLGRLTQDPQVKSLPSGQLVATFGLATNRFYYDKNGQKKQDTQFHQIVAFGNWAEIAHAYLKQGSMVLIEGRLQTRNWEDKDGQKRSRTEIIVERLQLGPRGVKEEVPPKEIPEEEIPVIEEEKEEIDVKDLPL